MSIFDRIGRIARASLTAPAPGPRSTDGKALSTLTDDELEEEILRRRRERAARRSGEAVVDERAGWDGRSPQEQQLAQYYANLELKPGASLEDVRKQYREMMRRYHPDKHVGDKERHKAATELAQSLTAAYRALVDHHERRGSGAPR